MAFLIDKLKEKIGGEDNGEKGFPDLNYIIGNSTAMDVGEVPTPLDERIGYASMIGGSLLELQITNPATFELEGDAMIRTIDQLDLDVTIHPDMNAGFTSAQKTGQGEQYGYETVEHYFTNYIQELAVFKKRVHDQGQGDPPLFNIGRMNPHISTSPLPPMNERMETDVGLGPFGFVTNTYDEENRKHRNYKGQNIYKNPDFLRKLYHTMFLEIADYPFQNYRTFAAYSEEFQNEWLKAQHIAAWIAYQRESGNIYDKLGAIQTARQQDQGVGPAWRNLLGEWDGVEFPQYKIITEEKEVNGNDQEVFDHLEESGTIGLKEILTGFGQDPTSLRALENIAYRLKEGEPALRRLIESPRQLKTFISNAPRFTNPMGQAREPLLDAVSEVESKLDSRKGEFKDDLENALDSLWHPESFDREDQNISQQAKWAGVKRSLEVEEIRLFEIAYRNANYEKSDYSHEFDERIEETAAKVFSGEEDLFDPDKRDDVESVEEMHEDLLERILTGQQFQRELWKESTLFYNVIPAWMSSADKSVKNEEGNVVHEGWKAPEFIWKALVEKWEDNDDKDVEVEIDLENPRNGVYDMNDDDKDDTYHFLDLVEAHDEFRMDVAAAVGACYAWAHFTQRKVQFDLKGRENELELKKDEAKEVQTDGWTWIDWMNRFGLGVNFETMAGSPQQRFKVWRPKDISVTAHAINLTARERVEDGELGGLDHIHGGLEGCPAKFTIDMEHVATMGAPPFHEMEEFWKQEEENLAEMDYDLEIDSNKPIAKIMRQVHLMDPGVEGQRGTHHGAIGRGNDQLYEWLYEFVDHGFARNENEPATILFELAEHKDESSYVMRIMMDLIQLGVEPEDLDPSRVDPSTDPESEEEALIARFYGIDRANYTREWAKVEEHAFDPLKGLLEAEDFDYTYSSKAAVDQGGMRPGEWQGEEYR